MSVNQNVGAQPQQSQQGRLERSIENAESNAVGLNDLLSRALSIMDRLQGAHPHGVDDQKAAEGPAGLCDRLDATNGAARESIDKLNSVLSEIDTLV